MSEYDVPTYNREEEEEQKLVDKVYDWWESLTEQEQFDIMYDHFPDEELEAQKDWYDPDLEIEERKLEEEFDCE